MELDLGGLIHGGFKDWMSFLYFIIYKEQQNSTTQTLLNGTSLSIGFINITKMREDTNNPPNLHRYIPETCLRSCTIHNKSFCFRN